MQLRTTAPALSLFFLFALLTPAAAAPISYGDFPGTDLDFIGVGEDSLTDPSVGLFGTPTRFGPTSNGLTFFPTVFISNSSGAGGADTTAGTLTMDLVAKNGQVIDLISITEFGDFALTGAGGAGTLASVAGLLSLTVTEVSGSPITPVPISPSSLIVSPGSPYTLAGGPASGVFSASVTIDVGAVVANATRITFSFDDTLDTTSEAGTTSQIQKNVLSEGVLLEVGLPGTVVPEPGSLLLLAVGSAGLLAYGWRRRRKA